MVPHPLLWASQKYVTHVENRVIELESAVKQCMVSIIRINKKIDNQDADIRQLMQNQDAMNETLKCIIRAIRLVNRRNDILYSCHRIEENSNNNVHNVINKNSIYPYVNMVEQERR